MPYYLSSCPVRLDTQAVRSLENVTLLQTRAAAAAVSVRLWSTQRRGRVRGWPSPCCWCHVSMYVYFDPLSHGNGEPLSCQPGVLRPRRRDPHWPLPPTTPLGGRNLETSIQKRIPWFYCMLQPRKPSARWSATRCPHKKKKRCR